ncbi:MAG: hypothetical protein ABJG78_12280 [Cyclobacteriaceae bacterium]
MKRFTYEVLTFIALLCLSHLATSNNIQVSNISLQNQNQGSQTVLVQFDVSWDNSWRISSGPSNWDAAWIFVKYRRNSGVWRHANINVASPGVAGGTLEVTSDEVGAMLYRDSDGTGNVSFTGVQLQWDYGENGVVDADVLDVQVFAIEMVYVPGGSFFLGDGTDTNVTATFLEFNIGLTPYHVLSEAPISIGPTLGNLYYQNPGGDAGDQTGTLATDFPKGFDAFYCMKYEATEGMWISFFNTLDGSMKNQRDITNSLVDHKGSDAIISRNTISIVAGNATTLAPDRVVNFLNLEDLTAYLDWSGLRPMTELEFEKSCRGPLTPMGGEFAWGNANLLASLASSYTLINDGLPNEQISNIYVNTGNAHFLSGGIDGYLRAGVFAASSINHTREETGSSYYGIMELSGNAIEMCVTVGNLNGRSYTGLHGDGNLTVSGNANVLNWPISGSTGGYGQRGGAANFYNIGSLLQVSNRKDAGAVDFSPYGYGLRGVRDF